MEQAGDLLKGIGLRRTLVRICVLQVLSRHRAAMSQADVSRALAGYGFDESTIFRSLADLVEQRLITRVDIGDKTWRFWLSPAAEGRSDSAAAEAAEGWVVHVCQACSRVTPLNAGHFRLEYAGGEIGASNVNEVVLRGLCGDCDERRTSGEVPHGESRRRKAKSTSSPRGPRHGD